MATKRICDACGYDMTEQPERLAIEFERRSLDVTQRGSSVWPGQRAIKVEIGATRIDHSEVGDTGRSSQPSDVCIDCIRRCLADGNPINMGPVTR